MAPYIVGRGRDARAGRRKIAFRLQPEKRLVAGLAASSFVPVTSDPWLDTRRTYPLPHARSAGAVVPPHHAVGLPLVGTWNLARRATWAQSAAWASACIRRDPQGGSARSDARRGRPNC